MRQVIYYLLVANNSLSEEERAKGGQREEREREGYAHKINKRKGNEGGWRMDVGVFVLFSSS